MRACAPLALTFSLIVLLVSCRVGTPSRVETPADSAAGTIGFEMIGAEAALAVPVYLNGQGPHRFVVDTGATLTCVDAALADSVDLPERAGQIGIGAGIGGAGNVRLVGIDSLRVGQTTAFDLTACALDLSQLETAGISADGLLGLNFLKSFRVTLDFTANTLRLQPL